MLKQYVDLRSDTVLLLYNISIHIKIYYFSCNIIFEKIAPQLNPV